MRIPVVRWLVFLLFVPSLVAACGAIAPPDPGCVDVYFDLLAWKARCGLVVPEDARDRAMTFCGSITHLDAIRWTAQSACDAALKTAECDRFPHDCVALGSGMLEGGARCEDLSSNDSIHAQCRSGRCESQGGACGTCTAVGSAGDACGDGGIPCAPGLACSIAKGSTTGRCAIATGAIGAPCSTITDCSTDGFCDYNTRVCAPRRAQGESCWSGYECVNGLACGGTPGRCVPPAAYGDPCTQTGCRSGLECANGVCRRPVATPMTNDGEPCVSTCRAFARCIDGKCALPAACS